MSSFQVPQTQRQYTGVEYISTDWEQTRDCDSSWTKRERERVRRDMQKSQKLATFQSAKKQ